MKVLVTGATGFVGSHLCDLLDGGDYEIFSLIRSKKKADEFDIAGNRIVGSLAPKGKLSFIEELPDDLDTVVHTAGIVHGHIKKNFDDVNHLATSNLFNQLKKKYKKLNFIFLSSLAASGPSEVELTEECENKPVSAYGLSKAMAEVFLKENCPKDWSLSIIRPPIVIGPRDPGMLDVFKMVSTKVVVYPGLNGAKKRYSIVSVFDLVEIIKVCIDKPQSDIFFSAYPKIYEYREIVEAIEKAMQKSALIKMAIPAPLIRLGAFSSSISNKVIRNNSKLTMDKYHELYPSAFLCNGSKVSSSLGLDYRWDLQKSVDIALKDYQSRGWL